MAADVATMRFVFDRFDSTPPSLGEVLASPPSRASIIVDFWLNIRHTWRGFPYSWVIDIVPRPDLQLFLTNFSNRLSAISFSGYVKRLGRSHNIEESIKLYHNISPLLIILHQSRPIPLLDPV
jgi:hypothetical protein